MAAHPPELFDELAAVLGPRGFTRDADIIMPWLTDWRGRTRGEAAALLSPASTAEVQAIVQIAARFGAALTLQGGNSGMCAGATPDDSGTALLLNLRRMNQMRSIDGAGRLLMADAGVILADAQAAAEAVECRFPLTLGGKGSATLGGLVSTNAGGTQVLRHGTMRALTAGLEVVLADGSLLDLMTPLAKDNQGPDPKQMFIGGEGVFGIVTGVALRLIPAVTARAVAWLTVEDPHAALHLLRTLDGALGGALEGFEIIPEAALAQVIAHESAMRRPIGEAAPWHVLIEAVDAQAGGEPATVLSEALQEAASEGLLHDAVLASSEAQAEAMWAIRDAISAAEKARGPALQHDVSVPVARMPHFIDAVAALVAERFPGASTLSFGHLGDGNVHCHVRPPGGSDAGRWIAEQGEAASRAVYALAVALGGSISAEHGIGRTKRTLFAELGDPARISVLRAMKRAMDPAGLLNPGVLIP
jgi:FAD/FMN-containing dehydrogenase